VFWALKTMSPGCTRLAPCVSWGTIWMWTAYASSPQRSAGCAKPTVLSLPVHLWHRCASFVYFLLFFTLRLWEFASEAREIELKMPMLLECITERFYVGASRERGKRRCN